MSLEMVDEDPWEYLGECYPATIVAGAIYPAILAGGAYLIVALTEGVTSPGFMPKSLGIALGGLTGVIVGAFIAAFTGLFALGIIGGINASIGNALGSRGCAIAAGGLSGFIPTAWAFVAEYGPGQAATQVMAILVGPVLATVVGSIVVYRWSPPPFSIRELEQGEEVAKSKAYQFKIFHVMAATGWFALISCFINLIGGPKFAILVCVWCVLQATIMLLSYGALGAWRSWRQRREMVRQARLA